MREEKVRVFGKIPFRSKWGWVRRRGGNRVRDRLHELNVCRRCRIEI